VRLDEAVVGLSLQCPSCHHTFTADRPRQSSAWHQETDEARRDYDDEPIPRRHYDERPRRRYEDDEDDDPRPPRRNYRGDLMPHRGQTIQILGILSLGLYFIFAPGAFVPAVAALILARNDLKAMNRGEMDDTGRAATQIGLTCGLISLGIYAFLAFVLLSCVGTNILQSLL
jgi:hypothetical protein